MGNSETYSYDLNNNLISKTDKNQNRIVNTYNALNQPLKCTVTQPDGTVQSQEISYALNGAKIKERNENLITNLHYDNQCRVISQEDSNGIKQSYTYDLAGNRITYQYVMGAGFVTLCALDNPPANSRQPFNLAYL
jgi:YD repeat-containing protein